ncbi:hypothetical protein Tco_0189932 [Tanacetum coccineum]
MANENVPAPAPTRSDDHILPFAASVPIGKSNFVLDSQKKQKNLIFQISVDILQNINFFRAFTTSASVPAIYIQQFWNTLTYEAKTGAYSFQLDENRFILYANLLREALEITPIDQAHQFVSPPSGDAIMDFVNELGYTEEIHFVSRMATFVVDKANLSIPPQKLREKDKKDQTGRSRYSLMSFGGGEELIMTCRIGKTHNIHQRFASPFHLAEEDHRLRNLKFVPKGEEDEHDQKTIAEEGGKKKSATKAGKSKKPATAKQLKPKPVKEKSSNPALAQKPKGQAHVGGVAIREPVVEATRPLPVDDASANIVRDSPSPADAETGADTNKTNSGGDTKLLQIGEELCEDVANVVDQEEKTAKINKGQAGSDPDKTLESQPPPERVLMEEDQARLDPGLSHAALAGPNPEPMHDDFVATVYPQVHESLKHPDEEYVHEDNPLSSIGTLSSMKNLDAFNFDDQFFNDKPTEEDMGKTNMETEVESMVTVLIHQASFSVPPLSTPVIDLSPPKPVPSTTQALVFTATTTTTTTTLPLPPPPQQQSTTDSELTARVTTLEKKFSDFEQKSKTLDNTTQNLGSRVFTLELRDLPHKINQTINEVVKEAIHVALQAPLRDRFRELPEADMKEMLHQWMFKSGSYKSLPEHVDLYESLEASMECANKDEFLAEKDKSRKRRHDDQDPPPPRLDSDLKAPSSSSKKKSAPHSEQPVKDVPIPYDMNILDSEDTNDAHLPKIRIPATWLRPLPEEDRPETPEPDWSVPPNDLPEPKNNWANALAKSYKDPKENMLL